MELENTLLIKLFVIKGVGSVARYKPFLENSSLQIDNSSSQTILWMNSKENADPEEFHTLQDRSTAEEVTKNLEF